MRDREATTPRSVRVIISFKRLLMRPGGSRPRVRPGALRGCFPHQVLPAAREGARVPAGTVVLRRCVPKKAVSGSTRVFKAAPSRRSLYLQVTQVNSQAYLRLESPRGYTIHYTIPESTRPGVAAARLLLSTQPPPGPWGGPAV